MYQMYEWCTRTGLGSHDGGDGIHMVSLISSIEIVHEWRLSRVNSAGPSVREDRKGMCPTDSACVRIASLWLQS